jgi:hypothetical protein
MTRTGSSDMKKNTRRSAFIVVSVVFAMLLLTTCDPIPLATTLRNLATPEQVWKFSQKLTATTDLVAGAYFGYAVSISRDYAIVGAYGETVSALSNAGAAYIFKRSGTTWTKLKRITATPPVAGSMFGSAVGIDGDYAIVGAFNNSNNKAYVFSKDQGGADAWGQTQVLTGAASSYFGYAVGIKGLHAIVGAWGESSGTGAAHIYFRDQNGSNVWGKVADVLDSTGSAGDNLGYSVTISDNYAAAGALNATSAKGLAVVYQKISDTNWGNALRLTSSDGAASDQFGYSVSMTDTNLVAGASGKQCAYVFTQTASSWGEIAKLFLTSSLASDQFGSAVSVYGSHLVIGAQGQDSNEGAVYPYDQNGGSWKASLNSPLYEQARAANDRFGNQFSICDAYLIVGSQGDGSTAANAGTAYVYMLGDY